MRQQKALEFLSRNQPLPDDRELTQDLINEYDAVRKLFKLEPNRESLSLFFGSFGEGDGLGVYQLIQDTILAHNREDVIVELVSALKTGTDSSRYWCAQIASSYPDKRLVEGLKIALGSEHVDIREAAIIALELIDSDKVSTLLKEQLVKEIDENLRELIKGILKL